MTELTREASLLRELGLNVNAMLRTHEPRLTREASLIRELGLNVNAVHVALLFTEFIPNLFVYFSIFFSKVIPCKHEKNGKISRAKDFSVKLNFPADG